MPPISSTEPNSAAAVPFEEIKADLLEKNIRVSLPLTSAYKAIDERGVVQIHKYANILKNVIIIFL